jgi:DNA-binding transcriptional MocR family regulator
MTDGWRPDLSKSDKPKYLAIASALTDDIMAGRLSAGSRLPPQRDLAARLGVDLTTVTKAYDIARGQGLIEARGRAGSFVIGAARIGETAKGPIDTGMNMPPEAIGGSLFAVIERTTTQLMRSPNAFAHLQYQPAGGLPLDREAGVRLFAARDLPAVVDQVIVTAGGQNALHAISATLFEPGDAVACGQHVYPGFLGIAQRLGLKLVPLPAMTAEALQSACAENTLRALYVVPTNDNPTGITLDLAERQAIAAAAERYGLQIIEDDAYGQLPADSPPPIASFAPERTWHIASTSKIISPALRVAHVRAPSVRAALRMSADIHETTVMAPSLNAAIVSAWVQDGSFAKLVAETRVEGRWRQSLARSILGDAAYSGHPDGYHFWLPLADELHPADLVNLLRPMGLSVVSSDAFAVGEARERALRVSLGGGIDRTRLARALHVLEAHLEPQGKRNLTI